ncbi:hypothetical protein AYO22_03509 [Fonsecaea multimorphosa]|nr:hypothetical protein AYO22_03509 [Fonsecaea multimorphosa]
MRWTADLTAEHTGNTRWDPAALWMHRKHANFSVLIVKETADLTRMIRSRTCLRIVNPPLRLSALGPVCSSCNQFLQFSSEAAVCLQPACRTAFCSACVENGIGRAHGGEHPGAVMRLKLYQVAAVAALGSEQDYAVMVAKATARYVVNCLSCRKGDSLLFFEGLFCTGCKSEGLCISCLAIAHTPLQRHPFYGCPKPKAGFNFGLHSSQTFPTRVPTGAEKPPGFMLKSTLRPCHVAYEKLPDTRDPPIRLVRLHPGEERDSIRFSIEMYSLSQCPRYEALSYTWGEVETPRILRTDKGELFLATENLEDEEEKSQQVKVMSKIYSQAAQVLVWLGPAADKSDIAFKWIKNYPRRKELIDSGAQDEDDVPWLLEALQMTGEVKLPQVKDRARIHPDLEGKLKTMREQGISWDLVFPMTQLRDRPYFSRVWTVQEVFYAKDILVLCGAQSVGWGTFISAYFAFWGTREMRSQHPFRSHGPHALEMLRRSLLPRSQALSQMVPEGSSLDETMAEAATWVSEMITVLNPRRERYLDLVTVLLWFRTHDATDPRDKVYALLSLAKPTTWITENYTKSVSETFKDVAFGLIADSGKLHVLTISICARRTDLSLPSWAPDWRATVERETEAPVVELYQQFQFNPLMMTHMRKYAASGRSRMKRRTNTTTMTTTVSEAVPERKGNILTLWGFVVDGLSEVAPKMPYIHHTKNRTKAQEEVILACLLAWDKLAMDLQFLHLSSDLYRHRQLPQSTAPEFASTSAFEIEAEAEAEAEDIYCLTLSRGTYWVGHGDRERTLREFRQWRACLLALQPQQPPSSRQHEDPHNRFFRSTTLAFYVHALRSWSNYTLAKTDAGLLVLGLGEMRRGDRVVLLKGCDLPLIVRAVDTTPAAASGVGTTGREEHWQLVGAAYVHGMMDGEMWDERQCQKMHFV